MLVAPGKPVSLSFEEPSFDQLRDRGRRAVEAGRLHDALESFEQALRVARGSGRPEQVDLATCNQAAVLITLGRHEEVLPGLRQILMASRNEASSFLAAYNLSRAHVRGKAVKKALFYARIARERAEATGRDEWSVWAYNQNANCLMDESHFEDASREYQRALDLLPGERSVLRASVICNLGYCQAVRGDLEGGYRLSVQSLRTHRALGARTYELWPHLDLCYIYLEIDRPERALRHARKGLVLAEALDDPDRIKGALFLLGEAERDCGDLAGARATFSRLQRNYFPDQPSAIEHMLGIGMYQLVNIRA